jgi:LysM repeat protein
MSKKLYLVFFTILTIGLLLSACERPASIAPVTTPTSNGEIPFPVATQPEIIKDILSATQTAAAASGTLGVGGEDATSTPAFTFVTPTSGAATSGVINLTTSTGDTISLTTSTTAATPTPTAINYPTPTPGIPTSYTLKKGEYLYCIARRFDVDPADLMSANGMNMYTAQNVQPGTKLIIPQNSNYPGERSRKTHPAYYTVAAGDTVYTIACDFGDADPNTIMAANGLTKDSVLTAGQVLYIP